MAVLLLWRQWYEQSCFALALPVLLYGAVFYSLATHRVERARFRAAYYLALDAPLRCFCRGRLLPVGTSLIAAAAMTALLAVFAALSRPTDWWFLGLAAVATPSGFVVVARWAGPQFRHGPANGAVSAVTDVLVARVVRIPVFITVALAYGFANYYLIPWPNEIDPDSLERTLTAFATPTAPRCSLVADVLSIASVLDALAWHSTVSVALSSAMSDGLRYALWAVFFAKTAVAFGGLIQGLIGSILPRRANGQRPPGNRLTPGGGVVASRR